MTIRRFFCLTPEKDGLVSITGEELHHLRTVNRAVKGDGLEVIDGKGHLYRGEIRSVNSREAVVGIINKEFREKPANRVIMAVSPAKKRALNVMIEKLTELGVDQIRPVVFARTDEKISASALEKWRRIALQSLKVNKRLWATEIYAPIPLKQLPARLAEMETETSSDSPAAVQRLLLDIDGQSGPIRRTGCAAAAVIGPPGGFTAEEKEFLMEAGFRGHRINDCVLKTETAAISIAAILKQNGLT